MFNKNLMDMIHDDITWCSDDKCTNTECERNQANRRQKTGLFSMALFRGTELCPLENDAPRFLQVKATVYLPINDDETPEEVEERFSDALVDIDADFATYNCTVVDDSGDSLHYKWKKECEEDGKE